MTAHSYLEYALTLLDWLINNGIWNTITATGLFALPLLIKQIAVWLKAREQGVDEGNKVALTVAGMENVIYVAIIVIMFTCVPLLNVDITEMQFDMTRSRQCNISLAQPDHTGYKPLINEVSGKTAAVPVCWYLIHTLSKGLVNAATAVSPICGKSVLRYSMLSACRRRKSMISPGSVHPFSCRTPVITIPITPVRPALSGLTMKTGMPGWWILAMVAIPPAISGGLIVISGYGRGCWRW